MDEEKPTFEGFRKPDKHFYHMPNEWTDVMADIDNLAEMKVIEYLIRHTWGFKEYDQFKFITIDEFMYGRLRFDGTRMDKGTGLKSDRSVKDGLKAAIEHGYILCEPNTKAKVKKSYKLKMQWVDTTQDVGSIYPENSQNLPTNKVVSTHKTPSGEKETETKMKESKKEGHSLPDFCLEKLTQVAQICDEDVGQHMAEAERIYQSSGKSRDEFYNLLYGVEALIKLYGPRTMQEFFRLLRENVER